MNDDDAIKPPDADPVRLPLDALPHIVQARAYWEGIRKGRRIPARTDLDPAAIKPLLPYILLVDVLSGPPDFRFRLVGTQLDRIVARNYTGVCFSALAHMRRGNKVWAQYEEVVVTGAPLCSEIDYVGTDHHVRRLVHALFPLSRDGRMVDVILGAVAIERQS